MTKRDLYADEYPESWYCVTPSKKVKASSAQDLVAFGKKLVLYRTAGGVARIAERFCPHMGASLAQGCVQGERIVCPFHNWEYGVDGACARIPYMNDDDIPSRARLATFHVVEQLGWIWMWHGRGEPRFALPEVAEEHDAKYGYRARTQQFDVHPLLILENGCDAQHFKYVHHVGFERYEVNGLEEGEHRFRFDVDQELAGPRGKRFLVQTSIEYAGAGAIFGRLSFNKKPMARFVAAPLPLGDKKTLFHLIVFPKKLPLPLFFVDPIWQSLFANKLFAGSTDDYFPIWKQMDPSKRGVLVEEDRLQQRFRRYYEDHFAPPPPKSLLAIAS